MNLVLGAEIAGLLVHYTFYMMLSHVTCDTVVFKVSFVDSQRVLKNRTHFTQRRTEPFHVK